MLQSRLIRRILAVTVFLSSAGLTFSATANPQEDCQGIFDKAPRNTTDITDRSQELLKYGRTICSSEWKTLTDVRNSNTNLSLSILDYIGLTSNDASSSQKFSEWKRSNCDNADLKHDIHQDLVKKTSFVSELVYSAYQTCITQRNQNNAATCAFVPTSSAEDGFLFVYFAPNTTRTETTLEGPITLTNGLWENGTKVLPESTKIRSRENFFPLKRTDIKKGDFFRVGLKGFPGDCSVQVPPWPTFNATLTLTAYYTQGGTARTPSFPVHWDAHGGMGPSWLCLPEITVRLIFGWHGPEHEGGPIDFTITDPQFDLKGNFPFPGPVPIYYVNTDKRCGYYGTQGIPSSGSYNWQVTASRQKLLGVFTKVETSLGAPITFKITDFKVPTNAAPGTGAGPFKYQIAISEQRGNIASPVVTLTDASPEAGGYKSSIDSRGQVTLTYQ